MQAFEREIELAATAAWLGEKFARDKKLKPLKRVLADLKPKKPQTPKQMLAALRAFQSRGADMQIRRVPA